MKRYVHIVLATLIIAIASPPRAVANENAALWQALKSGDHFVLIRHALAPGVGDPEEVDLTDCSTQRNLSDEGRQQARDMGALFRSNGIASATVMTSQWCRCRETASLMDLGPVEDMTALNSFFQRRQNKNRQMKAFDEWLVGADLSIPNVLVTHQVVITALTDYFPSSGEIVFVKRASSGDLKVAGTIDTLR